MLDHAPNSDTFQRHYLARNVNADLWAIHRSEQPQHDLIKQVTSHGSSRDPRRPISLTSEQTAALKTDPLYVRLSKTLTQLPIGPERQAVHRRRKALLERLRNEALRRVRDDWGTLQAQQDIDLQIQGQAFAPDTGRASRPTSPAQQRMLDALNAPLINNMVSQFERRDAAIMAIMAYCNVEEPVTTKVLEARHPPPPPEITEGLDPLERGRRFRASVMGSVGNVRRCFICIAKALTLNLGDPNVPTLTRQFYSHDSLSRHFVSVHLKPLGAETSGECPICMPPVWLSDKMHFQNHTEVVHGIRTIRVRADTNWASS